MSKIEPLVQLLRQKYSQRKIDIVTDKDILHVNVDGRYFLFELDVYINNQKFKPEIHELLGELDLICTEIDESFNLIKQQ